MYIYIFIHLCICLYTFIYIETTFTEYMGRSTSKRPPSKFKPPHPNPAPERAIRVWPMALPTSFTARDTCAPWFLIFCASSMTMPEANGCKVYPRNSTRIHPPKITQNDGFGKGDIFSIIFDIYVRFLRCTKNYGLENVPPFKYDYFLYLYVKFWRGKARDGFGDAVLFWNDEVSIGKFLLGDIFVGIPTNPKKHYPPQN